MRRRRDDYDCEDETRRGFFVRWCRRISSHRIALRPSLHTLEMRIWFSELKLFAPLIQHARAFLAAVADFLALHLISDARDPFFFCFTEGDENDFFYATRLQREEGEEITNHHKTSSRNATGRQIFLLKKKPYDLFFAPVPPTPVFSYLF